MTDYSIVGSTVSFEQIERLIRQIKDGVLNRSMIDAILERRNPFALERNRNGHITISFLGVDFLGMDEMTRLAAAGIYISDDARWCLSSTRDDSYDKNHRLIGGNLYKVALMPGSEIEPKCERTTEILNLRATHVYEYGIALAGFIPRIRELLSDSQMVELDVEYVAALHSPIVGEVGKEPNVLVSERFDPERHGKFGAPTDPSVLVSHRYGGAPWLSASAVSPNMPWDAKGLFIYQDLGI